MVRFRGSQTSLSLILVLQCTVATGQHFPAFVVRVGDGVTLPCENGKRESTCDRTVWLFSSSPQTRGEVLVKDGQIPKARADRLSTTERCSLVIQQVRERDVGQYGCRQAGQSAGDAVVELFAVNMTEQTSADEVTLGCSVLRYGECRHTVRWLFEGRHIDQNSDGLRTTQLICSASVSFTTSRFTHTSESDRLLKCEVSCHGGREEVLTFSPAHGHDTNPKDWWWFVAVAAALTALLITVVALVIWKRRKGRKTQVDGNVADVGDDNLYDFIDYTTSPVGKAEADAGDDDSYDSIDCSEAEADDGDDGLYDFIDYTTSPVGKAEIWGGDHNVISSDGSADDPDNIYANIS